MDGTLRKTVVVSAVSLRKGGTLTILRNCLEYLSGRTSEFRVLALVHDRSLCSYPGIEYMEMPWCTKTWLHRLWAEYVTMNGISHEIARQDGHEVWLWLSLHDTTPRVEAEHREVYCHTSFPFMKIQLRDFLMDPKVPLFAMFTRFAYGINVRKNDCLIVQQEWFRDAMSAMLHLPKEKFRVIPPATFPDMKKGELYYFPVMDHRKLSGIMRMLVGKGAKTFFYASTPDCHKNFETLCRAASLLKEEDFELIITVRGDENRYARWLKKNWGGVEKIDFHGFMTKEELWNTYRRADCFVFPSRVETWGLPVSEFRSVSSKPLLLPDLPYAKYYESTAVR